MKYYNSKCPRCRQEGKHIVRVISRTRGVKLQCPNCMRINLRYKKLNTLQEWEDLNSSVNSEVTSDEIIKSKEIFK